MQRFKRNEINAKDDALVQKLQKEVQYLKELLTQRKKGGDISQQLYILKDENERLRQMAMNYDDIEKMKQENKDMRLELQKLRNNSASEFNGSLYPAGNISGIGEHSPKSYDARHKVNNVKDNNNNLSDHNNDYPDSILSESEDI